MLHSTSASVLLLATKKYPGLHWKRAFPPGSIIVVIVRCPARVVVPFSPGNGNRTPKKEDSLIGKHLKNSSAKSMWDTCN